MAQDFATNLLNPTLACFYATERSQPAFLQVGHIHVIGLELGFLLSPLLRLAVCPLLQQTRGARRAAEALDVAGVRPTARCSTHC